MQFIESWNMSELLFLKGVNGHHFLNQFDTYSLNIPILWTETKSNLFERKFRVTGRFEWKKSCHDAKCIYYR